MVRAPDCFESRKVASFAVGDEALDAGKAVGPDVCRELLKPCANMGRLRLVVSKDLSFAFVHSAEVFVVGVVCCHLR